MSTMRIIQVVPLLLALSILPLHSGRLDGIAYLVAVTQMKANHVNEEALQQATPQPAQVKRAKALEKELSQVKATDPGAEKRVKEIDKQLTALQQEIKRTKGKAKVKSP